MGCAFVSAVPLRAEVVNEENQRPWKRFMAQAINKRQVVPSLNRHGGGFVGGNHGVTTEARDRPDLGTAISAEC